MYLEIGCEGTSTKRAVTTYTIQPPLMEDSGRPHHTDLNRLKTLCARIEHMARKRLGDSFVSLKEVAGSGLSLEVKIGTPIEKRAELQALWGWIALFDDEPSR